MLVAISIVALRLALWMFMDCIMSALLVLLRFATEATFLASSIEIIIVILVILENEIHLIVGPLVVAPILIVERLYRPVVLCHR